MNNNILFIVTVIGHSMEPLLKNGDLVYAKKIDRYEIGDILIFKRKTEILIHRYIDGGFGGDCIVCKGDNSFEVEIINFSDILGKAVLYEHCGIKKRILKPNNDFIKLANSVNVVYKNLGSNKTRTIKSELYCQYLKERKKLLEAQSALQY